MKMSELHIGMVVHSLTREFDYMEKARVEFVAHDWAVLRDGEQPVFVDDTNVELLNRGEFEE
jgi:hypothetical protein